MNNSNTKPMIPRYNMDRFNRFFGLYWEVHGPETVAGYANARRGDAQDAWVGQRETLRRHAENGTLGAVPNAVEIFELLGLKKSPTWLDDCTDWMHDPRTLKFDDSVQNPVKI